MDLSIRRMAGARGRREQRAGGLPTAGSNEHLRVSRFAYQRLGQADKGVMRRFLAKSTGLSLPRVERLIRQYAICSNTINVLRVFGQELAR